MLVLVSLLGVQAFRVIVSTNHMNREEALRPQELVADGVNLVAPCDSSLDWKHIVDVMSGVSPVITKRGLTEIPKSSSQSPLLISASPLSAAGRIGSFMDKQGLVPTHNMIWGDDNSAGSLTKEQIDKVSPIFPLHNMLILNRGWRSPVHDDRIKYGKIALAHPHVKGLMMEACPEAIAGRAGALFVTDVLAANKLAVFLMSPGPKVLSEGKGTYLDQIKRLIAYFEESGADIGSPDVVFSLAIYARQDHPEVSGFIDGATPIKHSLDFLMAHPLHSK